VVVTPAREREYLGLTGKSSDEIKKRIHFGGFKKKLHSVKVKKGGQAPAVGESARRTLADGTGRSRNKNGPRGPFFQTMYGLSVSRQSQGT